MYHCTPKIFKFNFRGVTRGNTLPTFCRAVNVSGEFAPSFYSIGREMDNYTKVCLSGWLCPCLNHMNLLVCALYLKNGLMKKVTIFEEIIIYL